MPAKNAPVPAQPATFDDLLHEIGKNYPAARLVGNADPLGGRSMGEIRAECVCESPDLCERAGICLRAYRS